MLAWASSVINLYITCCSDCTTRTLHMTKPAKPSLSKWGLGPQAQALPVAHLTLPWPHPLAWYCRSVWSWPYHCAARAAGSSWSVAKLYGRTHKKQLLYICTHKSKHVSHNFWCLLLSSYVFRLDCLQSDHSSYCLLLLKKSCLNCTWIYAADVKSRWLL